MVDWNVREKSVISDTFLVVFRIFSRDGCCFKVLVHVRNVCFIGFRDFIQLSIWVGSLFLRKGCEVSVVIVGRSTIAFVFFSFFFCCKNL